jgi:threonine 3-dehydrogenase
MKALVKREAKEGLWLEEVPVPEIKDDEVLIQPIKTAICGTDIHIYKWDSWAAKNVPVPLVTGHEFMGRVVEMGKNVKNLAIGEKVSGEGHITCGVCKNCLTGKRHLCPKTKVIGIHTHGCFADYFPLKGANVFKIPNGIPDEVAALFDPLGNAVHTALSFNLLGEDVLITGAGPIGIMAASIARHAGARHVIVTDVNDYRLGLAKQAGATAVFNVAKENLKDSLDKLHVEDGFTVALEMSGNPKALRDALETLQPGGGIGLLGILPADTQIDWDLVIFKMLSIKGIYGREIFNTWFRMADMLQSGMDISSVITHRMAAEDFQEGFDAMLSGNSGKVILEWVHERVEELEPPKKAERKIA